MPVATRVFDACCRGALQARGAGLKFDSSQGATVGTLGRDLRGSFGVIYPLIVTLRDPPRHEPWGGD